MVQKLGNPSARRGVTEEMHRFADSAIAAVAARQHGLITREQLMRAGVGRRGVELRLRRGTLHRVHRGVYLVGHAVPPLHAPHFAAVLACGERAVLSHRSALVAWDVLKPEDGDVDVTVAGRKPSHRRGIRVHQTRDAPPQSRRHGIPVTSAARTLLDFAEQGETREVERAFYEALAQRRTSLPQLRKLLDDSPGRKGAPLLRALLDQYGTPTVTRHAAEDILFALIRKGKLPAPERNVRVGGHELDFFWRTERVNAELDGYQWHRYRNERDQVRDAKLAAKGIRVTRISWRILTTEPEAVLVRLAQALSPGCAPRSAAAR